TISWALLAQRGGSNTTSPCSGQRPRSVSDLYHDSRAASAVCSASQREWPAQQKCGAINQKRRNCADSSALLWVRLRAALLVRTANGPKGTRARDFRKVPRCWPTSRRRPLPGRGGVGMFHEVELDVRRRKSDLSQGFSPIRIS